MKFVSRTITVLLLLALMFSFMPGATSSASAATCYWAQFIADVTIPDGTNFMPGTAFTKTWRLKNIGSCAWNSSDVSLIFDSGEQMGAPTSVALPITVNPGQTVDISVNMTAPSAAGHYLGYYKFKSTSGGKFGIGSTANSSFWIDIYVASSSGTGYDFTANAASATWSSGAGTLTFPGTDGSANGFSLKKNNPKLENGVESAQAGLLFAPNNITNGYIQAAYPAFYVQSGDRFQTTIGCEYGSTTCYVAYRLDYQIGSGSVKTFWTFHEKYEGLSYNANLDLSSLAGQNVKFILVISAYGSPTGDRALWVNPIISRAGGGTSPTGTPTTATPIPSTCDRAQFIADVTVPDGTIFAPGYTFNKTWRLKNIGTCTWTNYSLIFDSGEKMSGPDSALIPTSVAPGQTVDITVPLTSPTTIGTYRGYWKLKNSTGVPFGIGSGGTKSFWVEIYVSSSSVTTPVPPVGGVSYDFAANACLATWFSGAGVLPCPGSEGNSNGFVLKVAPSKLENGTNDSRLGLLTYPQNVYNGYIQGFYPAYTVKAGDRFRSIVNCEYNATSCYVVFRLEYQTGSDPIKSFWSFVEKYEGVYYLADIDLSPLVGKDVKFILTVLSTGSPTGDRALWVAPMIYNETGTIPPGASVTTINTDTPDPSMPGQNVAVNVSVNGAGATPTGTVVISGADTNCTITLSGGNGSCNVVFNTSGVRTLTATYSGDASHASSSGTASHSVSTVGLATSTTTIADIPDPTIPGQVVTVTVTVTGAGTTPTGTVDITGADTDCTLTLSGGSGSCTITFTTAGSKILTATYNGNVNYAGSSDTESHTVYTGLATTATTITSEIPDPSTTGQAVVVSVTVSGAGIPKPSGTVVITGADTNCTLLLSGGSGSCSVTFNTTGTKNLTAAYSGDGNYAPSSGSASHTVNKVSTTTTITADTPDPSSPSQAVSVSVTVLGAGVTPTGTVQITGADINCTLTLSGGSGSCNVVFNTIGTKTLTATYSGDSNYLASVAEAGHTVANATTTVITSAIPDPSTIGAAVTVNVTVSGAGVTPTGTVAITGANTNCTITLAAGTGSCDVTFNTAGAKTLTATYSGDANYGSSSGSMSHTVIQGSTTTAITTVLPEPSAPFESVTVTVTVTGTGVTAATGTVAITGADTICTVTLASGSGSCNVVFNTSGSKTLTATYSGDGNYLSSSSTAIHTVGTATTPPAVYKYDFGTASSPLEPTFTRITETSVYSSGVAGWTNTSGLQSRDRLAPDDRLRDFVQHISAARTFKVDLPNGNYSVSITMGDNDHLHDDMIVKANGTTVLTNVDNAAGAFAVNTFVVTVSGGSLSLEFSDGGGADPTWIVNSLTITTPP